MNDPIDLRTLDSRLAQRFIKLGRITEKEWEKHIKGLPDSSANAAPIESRMEHADVRGTADIAAPEEEE